MKVTSKGIENGIIADRFGKHGTQFNDVYMPTFSLPFKIEYAPQNTQSFAVYLEDKDAIPVCGYSWIHWTIANLKRNELNENESISATDFIQGTNSWSGGIVGADRMDSSFYGGMAPPDAPHIYELHIYALDTLLDLKRGFYYNELFKAMQGHILAHATLSGRYRN